MEIADMVLRCDNIESNRILYQQPCIRLLQTTDIFFIIKEKC